MTDQVRLLDARRVIITPGARVVYGFGVGRSVAMAEAVVMTDEWGDVSLTPSGRVRLRVVRRSYAQGEKDTVDVAPDRMTVVTGLPPSPEPTQAQVRHVRLIQQISRYEDDIRDLEETGVLPTWASRYGDSTEETLKRWRRILADSRDQLKKIDRRWAEHPEERWEA